MPAKARHVIAFPLVIPPLLEQASCRRRRGPKPWPCRELPDFATRTLSPAEGRCPPSASLLDVRDDERVGARVEDHFAARGQEPLDEGGELLGPRVGQPV